MKPQMTNCALCGKVKRKHDVGVHLWAATEVPLLQEVIECIEVWFCMDCWREFLRFVGKSYSQKASLIGNWGKYLKDPRDF